MPTDTCWTWKTLKSHDWWLSSLDAGACASRTPCKSSAIPPSASPPCVLPPFQVLHLLKNPVNYAQKCMRPLTSWNLISSSIFTFHCTFHLHSLHFIYILFSKMYSMALLHERIRGRDPDPQAEQQLCEWLALGAGCAGDGLGKGVQCFGFGCDHRISLGCLSPE